MVVELSVDDELESDELLFELDELLCDVVVAVPVVDVSCCVKSSAPTTPAVPSIETVPTTAKILFRVSTR